MRNFRIDLATKINYKEIEEIFKINVFANKEILDYLIKNKIKSNGNWYFIWCNAEEG